MLSLISNIINGPTSKNNIYLTRSLYKKDNSIFNNCNVGVIKIDNIIKLSVVVDNVIYRWSSTLLSPVYYKYIIDLRIPSSGTVKLFQEFFSITIFNCDTVYFIVSFSWLDHQQLLSLHIMLHVFV